MGTNYPIPGPESGWNQQATLLMCLPEVAPGSMNEWIQCGSGLNLDIFLLHPLTCKIPVRTAVCAQKRNRECRQRSPGQTPEKKPCTELANCTDPGGSSGQQTAPGKNRHLFWVGLCIPAGRCHCSKY